MAKISIKNIEPNIGLPGGTVKINGKGFMPWEINNENINFCDNTPWIEGASDSCIITSIPNKLSSGEISIDINENKSNKIPFYVPEVIATGLYIVDNPVVDPSGNIYATYSGSRGESTPVSLYKITPYGEKIVYLKGLTNATSLAVDADGTLFIASRFNGKIYKTHEEQEYELYTQGLGVAFGLAFDSEGNLFAGDRSGSIFKINYEGIAEFFTSIPQSYISFHLGFDKNDNLYVTNPTHIGENVIYKIDREGNVEEFFSGHSLFHGFCFDTDNNMYITEVKRHESRVIRMNLDTKEWQVIISGSNFIGVTFDNQRNLILATDKIIFKVDKELIE